MATIADIVEADLPDDAGEDGADPGKKIRAPAPAGPERLVFKFEHSYLGAAMAHLVAAIAPRLTQHTY